MAVEQGLKRPYTEALKEFERLVATGYEAALSFPDYERVRVALGAHEAGMQYILHQWKQKVEPAILGQKPLSGQRKRTRRHPARFNPYILDRISKGGSPYKLAKDYRGYKAGTLYDCKRRIDKKEWVKKRSRWVVAETGERVEKPTPKPRRRKR